MVLDTTTSKEKRKKRKLEYKTEYKNYKEFEDFIYFYLFKNGEMTLNELCREKNLKIPTAEIILNVLVSQGKIKKIGKHKKTRYVMGKW